MKKNKILALFFLVLIVVVTGLYKYFCPVWAPLPKLTGAYGVGINTKQLVDLDRSEIYSKDSNDKRMLMVDLYYPTRKTDQLYLYQPEMLKAFSQEVTAHSHLPGFIWNSLLTGLKGYAQPNAQIINTKPNYPIIISLPGIGGPAFNSDLEEVASWGYIVAAIYPTYDVDGVMFNDDKIIGLNPELRNYVAQNDRDNIYAYRGRAHQIWLQDVKFVLQELQKINHDSASMFFNKLDFNRLGILGVSHGGAVAIDFCRDNEICKAGIDMDGWTKTANTEQGFNKPFMFLMSPENVDKIDPLFINMGSLTQKVLIEGSVHANFGGPMLKWPLSKLFVNSKRDPIQIRTEILQYVRKFFDKYLDI